MFKSRGQWMLELQVALGLFKGFTLYADWHIMGSRMGYDSSNLCSHAQ